MTVHGCEVCAKSWQSDQAAAVFIDAIAEEGQPQVPAKYNKLINLLEKAPASVNITERLIEAIDVIEGKPPKKEKPKKKEVKTEEVPKKCCDNNNRYIPYRHDPDPYCCLVRCTKGVSPEPVLNRLNNCECCRKIKRRAKFNHSKSRWCCSNGLSYLCNRKC